MHFTQKNLHQDITYWPPSGGQNEFGHAIMGTPEVIKGRWENMNQQIRKPSGEEVMSRAEVFVDRDLQISGFLAQGDQTAAADYIAAGALEIQDFRTTPDLRNLDSERRAYL
jgi:hypothetical protein